MIRFHLDQHVANAVARGLRARQISTTTSVEAGLQDASDIEHLEYALAENRVIFTQDQDFLRLHAAGAKHAGVVFARQSSKTIGEIVHSLRSIHDTFTLEDLFGTVRYL